MFTVNFIIDGTPETAFAAQFVLKLASASGDRLVAHAFIDGDKVFQVEGFTGLPGLCGSGIFMEAYERIVSDLTALLESLFESLRARTEGANIFFEPHIWVRNPCGCCTPCICALTKAAPGALFVVAAHPANIELAKMIFEKTQSPVLIIKANDDKPAMLLSINPDDVTEISKALECPSTDIEHHQSIVPSPETFMVTLRSAVA